MRIKKGYSIWGLFPNEEKIYLNQIKYIVQKELISPKFESHMTIAGPYLKINVCFLNKLEKFVKNCSSIILEIKGYEFKEKFFESFYIAINKSEEINKIRNSIFDLKKFDLENNFSPHISMAYGNHPKKEKELLIPKLPKLNKSIKISKIALVEVDEDIKLWKIKKIYDLL